MTQLAHHFYLLGGDESAAREFLDERFGKESETPAESILHEVYELFRKEEATDFRERILFAGASDAPRVFAIHAQSFGPEAFEAMLKILEEPPKGIVIAITEHGASTIPDTIRSRAHSVRLTVTASDFDAKKFLVLTIPKRLVIVADVIAEHKDDETSAPLRSHAQQMMTAIIKEARKEISKERGEVLHELMTMMGYLATRGANVKMILEYMAMMI